ncbi:hypothetical protein HanXRQr2_Chr11g0510131 [Helianthus annuus]|uniref:Uncharacterized protein n=1 Tax=Helianthus annuus TaxID=4232 RepID=A0A9K3HST9_HELAN|nr:hypothetical protein HanXRQr2_Chr11g0510131 [Helianthus annuus]KAJ0502909.1 hypothetical protein HanHA300_Chr11g0418321 [Helianthus annuus]KAJ0518874.1 hypothetical protein HanHA89_Chr11g0442351 [Helianthus annuus]
MDLLKHYGIHFSQLHPLAFMRIVHFELSCVAFVGEPSLSFFHRFYQLQSDGDWITFAKRKDSISLPCYSFMPTSTYPKEWKNRFIFVLPSLVPESLPLRDPTAVIDDGIPALSAAKTVLWKKMYEHPTRAFNFLEGILAMRGLSPLYQIRPKAFHENKEMSLWNLLQADCKRISFVVEGVVNSEIGGILGGGTAGVGGAAGATEGTPSMKEGSPKGSSDSQNSPPVENMSSGDEDLGTCLSQNVRLIQ